MDDAQLLMLHLIFHRLVVEASEPVSGPYEHSSNTRSDITTCSLTMLTIFAAHRCGGLDLVELRVFSRMGAWPSQAPWTCF